MADSLGSSRIRSRSWMRWAGLDSLSAPDIAGRLTHIDWRSLNADSSIPQVVWLGHGSILILWNGQRMLVDPVFVKFIGLSPRYCPVPDDWRALNPDTVLLTHAHMDHFNVRTLSAFHSAKLVLPEKSERFLGGHFPGRIVRLKLNDKIARGPIRVKSVPAIHGGWRYPWQKGYMAFGYVLTDGAYTIYVAGDSAYGTHFKEIGKKHAIDLAILPIGAYSPRWFLKSRHMNPEEAVQACKDVGARSMIPCHFGTYRLSLEGMDEPLPRFAKCAQNRSCDWQLPIGLC